MKNPYANFGLPDPPQPEQKKKRRSWGVWITRLVGAALLVTPFALGVVSFRMMSTGILLLLVGEVGVLFPREERVSRHRMRREIAERYGKQEAEPAVPPEAFLRDLGRQDRRL